MEGISLTVPTDLKKLMDSINKKFGENTTHFMNEEFEIQIDTFSSGSLTLDLALGRGGFPKGYIMEFFGESMGGKTTISMLAIASFQRDELRRSLEEEDHAERYAMFVDAEHTFDAKLAREYGVDLSRLIYVNPKSAENAIDVLDAYIRTDSVGLAVVDSVPALVPSKIAESSIEQQTMGLLARMMGTTMQKITGPAHLHNCSIIFINQVREKIGVMYGNPMTTPGGKALPFYSAVRLHVRAGEQIKVKDEVIGHWMKIKIAKNKFAVPFKEATFPLIYGVGVDKVDEVAQLSKFAGIVRQTGAWLRYEDENGDLYIRNGAEMKFNGHNKFVEFLRENPEILAELENRLRGVDIEAPDGEIEPEYTIKENESFAE